MGLFGNKSDDDKLIEAYNRISSSGVVNCKIYVGRHGADEIVAGAMMGNTGKLIAMNNYGKAKFEHSVLELHINGIAFTNPGLEIMYHDIREFKIFDSFRHSDVFITLSNGATLRCEMMKYEAHAVIRRIEELKADYLERVKQEELEEQKKLAEDKKDKNMDRLLRAAELHDRGLLSEEEFNEIKDKFMNNSVNDSKDNGNVVSKGMFCPNCGSELKREYKFCINCGHEL